MKTKIKILKAMIIKLEKLLLSVQRALLGVITPELRAVIVSISKEELEVIFYYSGKISKKTFELTEEAIGQILIDFEGFPNKIEIKRLDFPKEIPSLKRYAYRRYE